MGTVVKSVLFGAMLVLAGMGPAHAVLVSYSVSGTGPMQFPGPVTPPSNAPWGTDGYPGDTVELAAYAGTLDLTAGSYILPLNTLLWTIDYTYAGTATDPDAWSNLAFDLDALRAISFAAGPTGSLSQEGRLDVTWFNDYLSFDDGSMASFVVQGFQVDVTPLGLPQIQGTNFSGSNPWAQPAQQMMGRFDVAPVPEPVTMLMLGGVGAGMFAARKLRRKNRA